jgi:hypothetical protein
VVNQALRALFIIDWLDSRVTIREAGRAGARIAILISQSLIEAIELNWRN